jgi:hypothetical protein
MVTSEKLRSSSMIAGITKCYKLYLKPVTASHNASYTEIKPGLGCDMNGRALKFTYRQSAFTQITQMRLSRIGYFLVLAFCAGTVSAQPGGFARPDRPGLYAFRNQGGQFEPSGQVAEQGRPRAEARRERYVTLPDTSGYGALNENNGDNGRRTGRLSPEERRALRRQIDEAGHDLYSGRR